MPAPARPTPAQQRRADRFLEQVTLPFRRSAVAAALRTRPMPRAEVDQLAAAVIQDWARRGLVALQPDRRWARVVRQRSLRDGSRVPEQTVPVTLELTTRCPRKWLAVDLETGEVWAGDDAGGWVRATSAQRDALARLKDSAET